MSREDRARWDARHAAGGALSPVPPGVVMGVPALVDAFPTAGRALDVACGRGGVAVWLALRGLAVDAVDVSPIGLGAGARLATAHGVGGRVRWIVHDLPGGYDVVVCQLFRDPARYAALAAAVAPGGLLAVTVLAQVDAGPGPFRAAPGELRTAFPGLSVLRYREADGAATLLARAPARPSVPPAPRGSPPAPRPPS